MVWNSLVNAPNNVRAKQIAFQNEKAPTYLKGNGKYYYRAYLALFAVSFVGANFQLLQFVRGKAKRHGEE